MDLLRSVERPQGPALTVVSDGGGQDSWAILCKLAYDEGFRRRHAPGRLLVVQSDPGDEDPETYAHVAYTRGFCARFGFEYHFLTADLGYHRGDWTSLTHFYRTHSAIGSVAYPKTCSDQLKIKPFYRFLEAWLGEEYGVEVGRKRGFYQFAERYGPARVLLGIARGEERRVADPDQDEPWMRATIERAYPLIEEGMDRMACQEYARSVGEPVPPPSMCLRCHWRTPVELLWLWRFRTEAFCEWVEMEQAKLLRFAHLGERNLGVYGKNTLMEVLSDAIRRYGHLTDEELHAYRMSHGHCNLNRF